MATIEEKEARKREIEQRHSRICADYVALLNEGKHTPHSIFETLAQKYAQCNKQRGVRILPETTPGIRNIIIKAGLYKTK